MCFLFVVSVDEPDSVELDSDLDHDDEPDCDAGDISPCASPAEDLDPSSDTTTDRYARLAMRQLQLPLRRSIGNL